MILLTGAAGFIGSNILKALNAQGREDIVCIDDLTDGRKIVNISGCRYAYYCDWRDMWRDMVKGRLRSFKISAIIHHGADSSTTGTNGRETMLANYSFSIELMDLAHSLGVPFIYASSAAVYGSVILPGPHKEENPATNLVSPYAYSKLAFDQYVMRYAGNSSSASKVVGLRYFNVYGPGEKHKDKMASLACQLIQQIKNDKTCALFEGSKEIFRDFVYIDDVVQVVLWALKEAPTGIYNVGTGTAKSFYDLYCAVAKAAGYKDCARRCRWIPFPEELRAQYQFYTRADLEKLRAAGFTREFTQLEEGVSRYFEVF